jgi:hypothetical protein
MQESNQKANIPGLVPSLKLGLGAIASFMKPVAGTSPCGEERMQIVPPVMTTRTRDSGYWEGEEAPEGKWWSILGGKGWSK